MNNIKPTPIKGALVKGMPVKVDITVKFGATPEYVVGVLYDIVVRGWYTGKTAYCVKVNGVRRAFYRNEIFAAI